MIGEIAMDAVITPAVRAAQAPTRIARSAPAGPRRHDCGYLGFFARWLIWATRNADR